MDFAFNEEQLALKEAVDKLVLNEYRFESRRRYQSEAGGWSRMVWKSLAEQGFLSFLFAPEHGGLGFGAVETMICQEAFGRVLLIEPFMSTAILVGSTLRFGASEEQLKRWVPEMQSGNSIAAWAPLELQSRYELHDVATTAQLKDGAFVLNGDKFGVIHGDSADWFIVSARERGTRDARDGISLFRVDAKTRGATIESFPTQDGLRGAHLSFRDCKVPQADRIGTAGQALPLLERVRDVGIAALAAEAVGAMESCLTLTTEYLKQRKQFGCFIGQFQALQHRAAEMLIELEQTRSIAIYAALMVDDPDPVTRRQALSAAKYQLGKSARLVGQAAIQLHGGLGVSEEYAIGHYFRRLTMMEMQFGDSDYHLSSYCEGA